MQATPEIYLIDNGSLRPEATIALRAIADQLSQRVGVEVSPVSLLHSHKVAAAELGGIAAQIVKSRLARSLEAGVREVIFLPLFLGPSRAITDYLPELIEAGHQTAGDFKAVIADTLAGSDLDTPDIRLAFILAEHVRRTIALAQFPHPKIALVDHGTPVQSVNRVRNAVARQLGELLGAEVESVVACSMERRAGEEFSFNEPLLENLDQIGALRGGDLIAAMFFLLPGRHAGAGGDVADICDGLLDRAGFKRIQTTPLLAEHPTLVDILEDRLRSALVGFDSGGA
jgi:sirohydrochlorin ferrochelatase